MLFISRKTPDSN